jgi:indolepyruvate ferredoxin oxidoreductase alpha subunit
MTGHQQNPATGKTLRNEDTWPLDLEKLVRAVGVKNVRVADPFDLAEMEKALREETAREEVSVIIARRPCALLTKTRETPLSIDGEACRRCGACLRIGCPAIEKGSDGRMSINPALCNGCGLCTKVCRFGAIRKGGEQV